MESSAKDVLHHHELGYRLLFERHPQPMWVYDVKTLHLLAVNEAALALYGYERQAFLGLTLLDLHHPGDLAQMQAYFQLPPGEQSMAWPWSHRHRNGDSMDVETEIENLEFDGVQACMVMVKDLKAQRRAEQEHIDLAYQLTRTLESITDSFFMLDRDWRFTYVNDRVLDIANLRREEMLGSVIWEKLPDLLGTDFQTEFERAMTGGKPASFETYCAPLAGWMSVHAYPSAQGLAVNVRNISDEYLAAQHLREEQETLAAVINTTADAIVSIDANGLIQMFNPGAERIFRCTRLSMEGQSLELLLPERFRLAHVQHRQRFAASNDTPRMMGLGVVKGLRSDGFELDMEGTISRVTVAHRQLLIVNLRDVTDRVRSTVAAQQSRLQLSELTQKLMTQEKMLVKRLAQTLHDQLGQTMAAVRMAHETVIALQGNVPSAMDKFQAQLGALISQAIRQIRQVLVDLRPPLLDEHGLAAALDNELRNRSLGHPKMDISIFVPPDIAQIRWPTEVEYAAFMIAREAIENALQHASASSVSVYLTGSPTSLQLIISDNGSGMPDGAAQKTGHLGLLGMQERAHAVAAMVKVDSGALQGTRIIFSWQPL